MIKQFTGMQIIKLIMILLPLTHIYKGTLTSSLIPVAPFATEEASAFPDQLTREVKEFAPLEVYHPHLHYHPHTTYINNLYIYPLSLKYDTQKMFAKVSTYFRAGGSSESLVRPMETVLNLIIMDMSTFITK